MCIAKALVSKRRKYTLAASDLRFLCLAGLGQYTFAFYSHSLSLLHALTDTQPPTYVPTDTPSHPPALTCSVTNLSSKLTHYLPSITDILLLATECVKRIVAVVIRLGIVILPQVFPFFSIIFFVTTFTAFFFTINITLIYYDFLRVTLLLLLLVIPPLQILQALQFIKKCIFIQDGDKEKQKKKKVWKYKHFRRIKAFARFDTQTVSLSEF